MEKKRIHVSMGARARSFVYFLFLLSVLMSVYHVHHLDIFGWQINIFVVRAHFIQRDSMVIAAIVGLVE